MLRPTAVWVEAICEYQILVEFDNGEKNVLMLNHISKANGMDSCELLSILNEYLQMDSLLYGLMDRIYARMICIIWEKWFHSNENSRSPGRLFLFTLDLFEFHGWCHW